MTTTGRAERHTPAMEGTTIAHACAPSSSIVRGFDARRWDGGLIMVTVRTPLMQIEVEQRPNRRCHRDIVLEGKRYGCVRSQHHDGAHDAMAVAADGGLVRW
jgi:hypothetical protein